MAATAALERGLRLYNVGGVGPLDDDWSPPPGVGQEVSVKLNDLLQLYRWEGREFEAEKTARAAMQLAGWPSTTQRPLHTHDRSLSARSSPHANKPWLTGPLPPTHEDETADTEPMTATNDFERLGLLEFIQRLESLTGIFRAEYDALVASNRDSNRSLMMPQTECLHRPPQSQHDGTRKHHGNENDPGVDLLGDWQYFPCKGDGGGGCAHRDTPQACSLLPALAEEHDVGLVRFGYSELGPGGWIRPHVGPSNAQLKIHLGLKVPQTRGDGSAEQVTSAGAASTTESTPRHCPASFTIAGQTRRWVAGRVLLFDDSYEHEVRNGCSASRAVLQLVIAHPAAAAPGRP